MQKVLNMEKLVELAEERKFRLLKEILSMMNEVDTAAFLQELSKEQMVLVFRTLPKELAAEVFANLEPDEQEHIINQITDKELSNIIEELYVDDAVDLLEELPAALVKRVLKNASPDTRDLINQFLNYPENSAGSIMTAEYVGLQKDMTVEEAFGYIRCHGMDKETIYTCYVMDEKRYLEGVVTVRDLLMNPYEAVLGQIMDGNVIKAVTAEDREAVAERFLKYDLLSLPVVDSENRLVGIVTIDDIVDVLEEEATHPSEKPYLKTGVLELAKNRILWLLVLMVSSMITGGILARYEAAFAVMPILVSFIPMLMDTGGNAGSQSSTLIIRGMAVNEIQLGDVLKVLWKELRVGLLVGAVLGVVNFIQLDLRYPGQKMVCFTVVVSLLVTIVIAKTIGGLLPMAAKRLRLDPAIMAAPLITTIVDGASRVVYFGLAVRLLHLS